MPDNQQFKHLTAHAEKRNKTKACCKIEDQKLTCVFFIHENLTHFLWVLLRSILNLNKQTSCQSTLLIKYCLNLAYSTTIHTGLYFTPMAHHAQPSKLNELPTYLPFQLSQPRSTRSSAIAEGPRDALVSINPATTKHPILKWLQSTNDLEVYTPKVIVIAAFFVGRISRAVSGL